MPVMEQMHVDVDADPTFADENSSDGRREESPVHRRESWHIKFVDDEAEASGEESIVYGEAFVTSSDRYSIDDA